MSKIEKKIVEKLPILGSSVDNESLSLSVKALVPLALVLLVKFGIDITADELLNLVELGVGIASSVALFIGVVRKIVVRNKN